MPREHSRVCQRKSAWEGTLEAWALVRLTGAESESELIALHDLRPHSTSTSFETTACSPQTSVLLLVYTNM
jgi:hypothetical protein